MLRASELRDAIDLDYEMRGQGRTSYYPSPKREGAKEPTAGPFVEVIDPRGHVTYHSKARRTS